MPGLVPGIHVFASLSKKDVDGRAFATPKGLRPRRRDKPGHDEREWAYSRRGLIFHVAARMATVITALNTAASGMVTASAAVAAHPIEQKASAKVASRDEVWRRRNWLRLACTRNQSWIEPAETVATMTPSAVTTACVTEANASATI